MADALKVGEEANGAAWKLVAGFLDARDVAILRSTSSYLRNAIPPPPSAPLSSSVSSATSPDADSSPSSSTGSAVSETERKEEKEGAESCRGGQPPGSPGWHSSAKRPRRRTFLMCNHRGSPKAEAKKGKEEKAATPERQDSPKMTETEDKEEGETKDPEREQPQEMGAAASKAAETEGEEDKKETAKTEPTLASPEIPSVVVSVVSPLTSPLRSEESPPHRDAFSDGDQPARLAGEAMMKDTTARTWSVSRASDREERKFSGTSREKAAEHAQPRRCSSAGLAPESPSSLRRSHVHVSPAVSKRAEELKRGSAMRKRAGSTPTKRRAQVFRATTVDALESVGDGEPKKRMGGASGSLVRPSMRFSLLQAALDLASVRRVRMTAAEEEKLLQDNVLKASGKGLQVLQKDVAASATAADLSGNVFVAIPAQLEAAVALTQLNLSANYLRSCTLNWQKLTSLTSLDLAGNHLCQLPRDLASLSCLEKLNLDKNFIRAISAASELPKSLVELRLRSNRIAGTPSGIRDLPALRLVDLRDNCLLMPEPVAELTEGSLVLLLLGNVDMTDPDAVGRLARHTKLSLAQQRLAAFPLSMCSLSALVNLDLSNNRLVGLPFEMKQLASLEVLVLDHNDFTSIPLAVGKLPNLLTLCMNNNRVSVLRVAPSPGDKKARANLFPSLRNISLRHNKMTNMLLCLSEVMPKLQHLCLDHNLLETVPSGNWMPKGLKLIDLSDNNIVSLSEVQFAATLHSVILQDNQLSQIPLGLASCRRLVHFDVTNNPLDCIPSDVLAQSGTTEVMEYLRRLASDRKPLNVSKLVVLGNAALGKSQFLRNLRRIGSSVNDQKRDTRGSQKREQRFGPLRSRSTAKAKKNMWQPYGDYPFQFQVSKYQTSTAFHVHRCLHGSANTAYILIFHMGRPADFGDMIARWLSTVQKDAPGAAVFLVGMHMDAQQDAKAYLSAINKRISALVEAHVKRVPEDQRVRVQECVIQLSDEPQDTSKYNSLRRFTVDIAQAGGMQKSSNHRIAVVGNNDDGDHLCFWPISGGNRSELYEQLRQRLVDVALTNPVVLQEVSRQYAELQILLEQEARERSPPVMPWADLVKLAKPLEMDEGMVRKVCEQLDLAGCLFYRPGTGTILSENVILEPALVHRTVSSLQPLMRRGVVELDEILKLWPDYNARAHRLLLQLLLYFEVIVSVGVGAKGVRYLAPLLLSEERPSVPPTTAFHEGMVARTFRFPVVLPVDFISGLFRRFLKFATAEHLWQAGCVLQLGTETCVVEYVEVYDTERGKCTSDVRVVCYASEGKQPTSLFQPVIFSLESMCMDWYSRLRSSAQVYVPCASCLRQGVEKAHHYDVEQCISLFMEEGVTEFSCPHGHTSDAVQVIPEFLSPYQPNAALEAAVSGGALGEGSYAQVFRAQHEIEGRQVEVAIKQMRSFMLSSQSLVEFQNEVALLRMLDHPNIIRQYHAFTRPPSIVMEFLEKGSLDRYVYPPAPELSLAQQLRLAVDIAEGLLCMHMQATPMLHRDMKSANVLVASLDPTAEVCAKICDLGLSVMYTGNESKGTNDNPRWTAPEVLLGKAYTPKSDVYSFAMVLYEIVGRALPFEDDSFEFIVKERALAGDRPTIPKHCPEALADVLRSCWAQDPARRPHLIDMLPQLKELLRKELGVEQSSKEKEEAESRRCHWRKANPDLIQAAPLQLGSPQRDERLRFALIGGRTSLANRSMEVLPVRRSTRESLSVSTDSVRPAEL